MNVVKKIRRVLLILMILLICWLILVGTDFFRMENGMNPIFCIKGKTYGDAIVHQDGNAEKASGTQEYWGLGYKAYQLQVNQEDENKQPVLAPFWESIESLKARFQE